MPAERPSKAARKPAARRRRRHPGATHPGRVWVVVAVIVALGILGAIAFDDRHWQAFDDAGDVAYERGNYAYAERMYDQALQVARDLEDRQLIVTSLQALSRAYAAQGRQDEARAAAAEAAQVRAR